MRRLLQSSVVGIAAVALVMPAAPAFAASADSGSGLAPVGSAAAVPSMATSLGAVPSDQPISFDVVLKPRNQAALDQFVHDVSTPGSPQYHQFLKTGEFDARFGPTPQAIGAVTAQMKRLGLSVDSVSGSLVHVSGSTTKVASALHTSFKQYRLKSGRVARANVAAPELPSSVAPLIGGVLGLNNLTIAVHPQMRVASTSATPVVAPHSSSAPVPCTAAANASGSPYTADEIASQYGSTSFYNAGDFGDGVTVALFELEPFSMSDINAYQTCYGTNASVSVVNVDGGPGTGNGQGEAALDIEDVIGLAPHAHVLVYQGPLDDPNTLTYGDMFDTYNKIATDNLAQVVSTSWGSCEPLTDHTFAALEYGVFQKMAAQGQTMFAASGDEGSADCDRPAGTDSELAVDDPASQPYVTGVGGTDLASLGQPETTWNEGVVCCVDGKPVVSAGGGGKSIFWSRPSWQTVTDTVREVPDVSASADPSHGYAVSFAGSWGAIGGTSAAAPTWAALVALIDSTCGGHRLGLINPAMYQLAASGSSPFNDVTTDNNDGDGQNNGLYAAGAGYDMATGLGTPKGAMLGAGLCPAPASAGAGTLTVDKTTVPVSSATTLTFSYTLPAGNGMADGEIDITVPSGWSPPSTAGTDPGFTTSSLGQVSTSSGAIVVKGLTATAGVTVKVTYGDTSGGGTGASTPSTPRQSTFAAAVTGTYSVAPKAITTSPTVVVWAAATAGQGTMTVNPMAALANAPTTLTFTYTPPVYTKLVNGTVTIDVPGTWTPPQTTDGTAPAYVTVNTGSPTISTGITVTGVNLNLGEALTIVYGAGGRGGIAPAPSALTFTTTQGGSALAQSPIVTTYDNAPDGTGTLTASPSRVTPGSYATLTFTYEAPADGFVTNGELTIDIPADWSPPSTNSGDAGEVEAPPGFLGTITTTGQTIYVTSIDLSPGDTLAIKYGTTANRGPGAQTPSANGSAIFKSKQQSTSGGNLTDLPDVTVSVAPPPPSGGGGGGAFGHPDLTRVSGPDRIATSVAASQAAFPKANSARVAVLARSDSFADALAGTPLAAKEGGPLLLTFTSALPATTAGELTRVLPGGSTVYLLGGTSAVSANVQNALANMGYSVTRLAGADRYATAVAVAGALGNPTTVFEADGTNFPDALSAGSAAAQQGAAVLLTAGGQQSSATAGYLAAHPSVRYAVGGPAAKADPGATPLVGADRFATSVAVAKMFFNAPLSVGLASGMNFPDALSGGAVTANHGGPILLVPSTGAVPAGTTGYLTQTAALSASSAWLFGGAASVSDNVFTQASTALKAPAS